MQDFHLDKGLLFGPQRMREYGSLILTRRSVISPFVTAASKQAPQGDRVENRRVISEIVHVRKTGPLVRWACLP
jgi:hypothetical protein